ncbi:MAG: hypothetical protein KKD01_09875 [Proteobacteria bacterium]|nr:hypothetical protein [Pseudomonadota bacterium]MBU1420721.1 hypothetical protein [Pseudomonadota bacterium]MBU1455020.1 hypothetical protein [Pseudomonadota bacterium]
MAANTQTITQTQVKVGYETSKFALGAGIASAAMIGLWATACMASALFSTGLGGTLKALFIVITGN